MVPVPDLRPGLAARSLEKGALSTGHGLPLPLDVFLCNADTQSSDYYFSRSSLNLLTPFPPNILGIVY